MNIIVVDDEKTITTSLERLLKRYGHEVNSFNDPVMAMEFIRKNVVHTVFTDINMPVISGNELLTMIKRDSLFKEVAVVLFTGYGSVKDAVEAMKEGAFDYLLKPIDVIELEILIKRIGDYLSLKVEFLKLSEKFDQEVNRKTADLKERYTHLQEAFSKAVGITEVGIYSDTIKEIFALAEKYHKDRKIPVLIEGETGTGKEIVAKFIHYGREVVTTPFIAINCPSISPHLFESELFGYEPGAFTGGSPKGQKGKFDLAQGGTLFLDEVGDMPIDFQSKLLRTLQEKEFYRVGGINKIKTDVRIICATNLDLQKKVDEGAFRRDLFYRLNVGIIKIPPLRERKDEIIPLADMFLDHFHQIKKNEKKAISKEAKQILLNHYWEGNIRELRNVLERIDTIYEDIIIRPEHIIQIISYKPLKINDSVKVAKNPDNLTLDEHIKKIIEETLLSKKFNKAETARILGIKRSKLYWYLSRYSIDA